MHYDERTKIHYGGEGLPIRDIGIGELLVERLRQGGDKVAMVDADTEATLTYNELLRQVSIFTRVFEQFGLNKGDSIAFYSNNRIEFMIPLIAGLYKGVIVAPINFEYVKDELVHCVSITKPKLIFCTQSNVQQVLNVLPKCKFLQKVVIYDHQASKPSFQAPNTEIFSYKQLLQQYQNQTNLPPPVRVDVANDVACVFSSSGTTGLPKGVMLTHRNVLASYTWFRDPAIQLDQGAEVIIMFLPLFHAYGNQATIYSLLDNTKSIIMARFHEERFYQLVEKYKVTLNYVVPPICVLISKSEIAKKYDLSSLRTFMSGAAPLSREVEVALQKKINLPYIRQGYGMTETTLGVIITPYERLDGKSGTTGCVIPGMMVKVVDIDTGEAVGPNKRGEVCMKGEMIMKGYFNNPKATAETIDKDGWLHSGDIGYFDNDNYFYIVDRLKELIKCKGFQVAPAELEALILTHPKVQDVGVVGIPDEMSGEIPCAFVVKKANMDIKESEIIKYVAERVSRQKHLGRVVFVNEIPKNPSGKILRRRLREIAVSLIPKI